VARDEKKSSIGKRNEDVIEESDEQEAPIWSVIINKKKARRKHRIRVQTEIRRSRRYQDDEGRKTVTDTEGIDSIDPSDLHTDRRQYLWRQEQDLLRRKLELTRQNETWLGSRRRPDRRIIIYVQIIDN